jgi:hypothetical protein
VQVSSATEAAAEVFPGLPCAHGNGSAIGNALSSTPHSMAWLENGQCVGFAVLSKGGPGTDDSFTTRGVDLFAAANDPERERARILGQIARQNLNLPVDNTMTVLFLAPLSRTSGSHSINALWQLDGAMEAQKDVNAQGTVNVRLVVANSGENFISGASVVQAVNRAFPRKAQDSWSIRAVIGIAQSRTIAREALAQLDNVHIVAASVNGGSMRRGELIDSGKDFGHLFVSVSPSDQQVAGAMLSSEVVGRASAMLPDPRSSAARLRVVRDPDDTYFSKELSILLQSQAKKAPGGPDVSGLNTPDNLRETDPHSVVTALARQMCAPQNRQVIWMFAGRGNRLADLDHEMTRLGFTGCAPVIVAGPGGIAAVATSDVPKANLDHMDDMLFYSLVPAPKPTVTANSPKLPGHQFAIGTAQGSDRTTGYTSLVEAVRQLSTGKSRNCPSPGGEIAQIGMSIPTSASSDGHNTLGPGDAECGAKIGSYVYFCPFDTGRTQACTAAPPLGGWPENTPGTPGKAPAVTAAADRGDNDPAALRWYDRPAKNQAPRADALAWDTKDIRVLCAVPGENRTDGWVGVYVRGRGTGFVHWKVRYAMLNRYLRFTVPGAPGFSTKTDLISDHASTTTCRTTDQLDRRAEG